MFKWRNILFVAVLLFVITGTVLAETVDISVEKAVLLIKDEAYLQLVDTRTKAERENGFIAGSILIPLDKDFPEAIKTLDTNKPVFLYCAVGGRSYFASRYFAKNGFKRVYNLKGGVKAWQKAGHSLVKD